MSEKTAYVRSVLRDIPTDVGIVTHCHTHLWIDGAELGEHSPVKPIDDYDMSLSEIRSIGEEGGCIIADAQPTGAGGSPEALAALSRASGYDIIASTGFHKLSFYRSDSFIHSEAEKALTARFVSDIRDRRCGMIKVALDSCGISGRYEILHAAAAAASAETGAPVMCHVEKGADPLDAVRFYGKRGVLPTSLILCHLDRAVSDRAVHAEAAKIGAYLEYDTIGKPKYHTDAFELEQIDALLDAGLADRLLLGIDNIRERMIAYGYESSIGLRYLTKTFFPEMLEHGIPAETVGMITKKNPLRAFGFVLR